jgi:hypothetical protein
VQYVAIIAHFFNPADCIAFPSRRGRITYYYKELACACAVAETRVTSGTSIGSIK